MPTPLDLATKTQITFVDIRHNIPPAPGPIVFELYCDADTDQTIGGFPSPFKATPSMKVKMHEYRGGMSEESPTLVLPKDTFLDTLSNGEPHVPVSCTIFQVLTGIGVADQTMWLFAGDVALTIRNYQGNDDHVGLKFSTWKQESARSVGFPANPQCLWTFRGFGCVEEDPLNPGTFLSNVTPTNFPVGANFNGVVNSINQNVITIASLGGGGGPPADDVLHRGIAQFGGLSIGIRDWDLATPLTIHLERSAPASWLGQTVEFLFGCDKTYLTCENRFANTRQFGGFGMGFRDYNPLFEIRS